MKNKHPPYPNQLSGVFVLAKKYDEAQKQQNPTFSGWVLKVTVPVGETNSHSLGQTAFEHR
tara:strand:- start:224 stop:406 length:183 start_codon:yes stop_codon:yes gene_type:complete